MRWSLFIAVSAAALHYIHTSYYELVPGNATAVVANVQGPQVTTYPPRHHIAMVDIVLTQLSLGRYLYAHLGGHVEYYPERWLLPPNGSVEDFTRQGYIDMAMAKDSASYVALTRAGYSTSRRAAGALVYEIAPHSPFERSHIRVGDRLTAINGLPIHGSCDSLLPGTRIALKVQAAHISGAGVVTYGAEDVHYLAMVRHRGDYSTDCPGARSQPKAALGVSLANAVAYALPASVTIPTKYVGGPSGGLAMTLAILDRLSPTSLAGHHRVAVTGTISDNGTVGTIGGIAEKTTAAIRKHFDVFIVPKRQVGEARRADQGKIRIIGVANIDQALRALQRLSGSTVPQGH